MALIEVKRTPEGKVLARRKDGQPLTPEDREEAKLLAQAEQAPLRAWLVEEVREGDSLRAVLICSALLDDHLWLILDRSFVPTDGLAVYFQEEIPLLKTKTPEDLKQIHKVMLAFPGCRVIQEGAEKVNRG